MTDRELLEVAAKAAGIALEFNDKGMPGYYGQWRGLPQWKEWNPLDDNGDAQWLAVKSNFVVEPGRCWVSRHGPMFGEDVLPCPYAATRRAIVRAAAAIGAST